MVSQSIQTSIIRMTILPIIIMLILLMGLKCIEAVDDTKQQLQLYADQSLSQLVTASDVYLSLGNQDALQRHIERLVQQQEIETISITDYKSQHTFATRTKENKVDKTAYARLLHGLVPKDSIVWEQKILRRMINPLVFDETMQAPPEIEATIGIIELVLNPYRIASRNVLRVLYHFLISLAGVSLIILLSVLFAKRLARPLTSLAERSDTIRRRIQEEASEDHPYSYPVIPEEIEINEMAVLESGFSHMVTAWESAKHDLEQRVQKATAQIQALLEETFRIAEREKRFLANELHDELGQVLVQLKWQAISIRDADEGEVSFKELCGRGAELEAGIVGVYALVNTIIDRLHPGELETLGLKMALQRVIDEWNLTNKTCKYSLSLNYDNIDNLDSELSLIAYRIVQEAITNASKHAKASNVTATIDEGGNKGTLHLQIVDDGIGFDVESIGSTCRGIKTMRERAATFGGSLTVSSKAGEEGTTIDATIPVDTRKPTAKIRM